MDDLTAFELSVIFGRGGNGEMYQRESWSNSEPGHVWSLGKRSSIWLPIADPDRAYAVLITFTPFLYPPQQLSQRLTVLMRGQRLTHLVADQGMTIGVVIPAHSARAMADLPTGVTLEFHHPDAEQPSNLGLADDRCLGIALRELRLLPLRPRPAMPVSPRALDPLPLPEDADEAACEPACRRAVGMGGTDLMAKFESLGQNCEFGLVQRKLGAEPFGLFRFAGVSLPSLLSGLENGFAGIGAAENLRPFLSGERQEYMMRETRYELEYHSWSFAADIDEATVILQQAKRMAYLRRRFVEDMETGDKIFVIQRLEPLADAQAAAVLAMLDRFGSNRLLLVVTDPDRPSGAVEIVAPGLMVGTLSRLAPIEDAGDLLLGAWTSLCANAYRLDRIARGL